MADAIYNNSVTKYYDFLFIELGDKRTNHWPLLGSPIPGLTIIGLYLYFILSYGPRFMANRKPLNLRYVLIVYNFFQVGISVWLVWEAMDAAWTHYSWKCEPVDFSNSPSAMRIAWGVYIYFLAKISELLDTVFFVLRKKHNQITFLHMYHHTVMPMVSWGAAKYYPGGHGTFIGTINSFVHVIMYTYYALAALGDQWQKYLWWKKYITTLQLLQFCIAFIHSSQLLFTDCGYPRWSVYFTLPNAIFFYYLFSDFYNKAYGSSTPKGKGKDGKEVANGVPNGKAQMNGHNGVALSNGKMETAKTK
ncbi:elongation of very long chain fatty acids protein AAEL008004-like [Diaphorina citri]|uniref:Elongation of very long chain fatty acids protein n=1 Tax=Diaphorina citri TaxID=121845 RepID=A0A1S3D216_DIACI|nr:elongation of very long chain fatty acids protein AAEL008004-like [Diaphorina citri]KAI5754139.1 hypothetical protein M8J77_006077 [Diaphorina citri]